MNKISALAIMISLFLLAACSENTTTSPESPDDSDGAGHQSSGEDSDEGNYGNSDGSPEEDKTGDPDLDKTVSNQNTGEYHSIGRVFETEGGENPQAGVEFFDEYSTEIYFNPGSEDVKVNDHLIVYYYQNPDGSLKFSRYTPTSDPSKLSAENACESYSPDSNWLEKEKECERVSEAYCQKLGGIFEECASACRHDTQANECIEICVPVCSGLG